MGYVEQHVRTREQQHVQENGVLGRCQRVTKLVPMTREQAERETQRKRRSHSGKPHPSQ